MYNPIDDTQDYPFSKLKLVGKTQLNVPTNQVSVEPPKLLSQRIRKRYYKALATNVNEQSVVPSLCEKIYINLKKLRIIYNTK